MRKKVIKSAFLTYLVLVVAVLGACGSDKEEHRENRAGETSKADDDLQQQSDSGIAAKEDMEESLEDEPIDFDELREINPDIFAWLSVPGTEIDYPVLQSGQSDTFYESHDAEGKEDDTGAVYIELANLTSMCDFNTVLHGKTGEEGDSLFADLYRFADPDFFKDHEYAYLYLDGNVLTYEIFAAYERENTSLIRTYDFTYLSGCQQFLDDLYGTRDMTLNLREGWENVSAYSYLITLTTQKELSAERQFVVLAVLVQDEAGAISRVVTE